MHAPLTSLLSAALLIFGCSSVPPYPLEPEAQARFHVDKGRSWFDQGDCEQAAIQFNMSLIRPSGPAKLRELFSISPPIKTCFVAYFEKIAVDASEEELATILEKTVIAKTEGLIEADVANALIARIDGALEERRQLRAEEQLLREQEERHKEEQRVQLEENRRRMIARLAELEANAIFLCRDKTECDKAFSLTQIYIDSMADKKLQVTTDTILETYNPTENGEIGLKALRIPGNGTSASIVLTVHCKDKIGADLCLLKKTDIYSGFQPFLARRLRK